MNIGITKREIWTVEFTNNLKKDFLTKEETQSYIDSYIDITLDEKGNTCTRLHHADPLEEVENYTPSLEGVLTKLKKVLRSKREDFFRINEQSDLRTLVLTG